jgi:uncharacterized protein
MSSRPHWFAKRCNARLTNVSNSWTILLIMPVTVVTSILLSVLFGQSIDQLMFSKEFSFSVGFVPVFLVLFLAASFEELGWRDYAMDSLSSKYNYFTATLIFAALWAFWHFPLFFVKNYYQNELLRTNTLFAANFMVSVFPMAFIISWLCDKNSGSILIAVLFHFIINISQEALRMGQITKCIETIVLIVIAAIIVITNKKMFFEKVTRRVSINEQISK